MRSSSFRSILFAAALCLSAAAISTFHRAVDVVANAARVVKSVLLDGFKLASPETVIQRQPLVRFVAAKAFTARFLKRERPQMSGSWRMCPSI